ncbi:hypothetical protein SLA2020_475080 [Shorea laevis]
MDIRSPAICISNNIFRSSPNVRTGRRLCAMANTNRVIASKTAFELQLTVCSGITMGLIVERNRSIAIHKNTLASPKNACLRHLTRIRLDSRTQGD